MREEGAEKEEEASTARLGEVLAKTIRHFFPEWDEWLKEIRDPRDPIRTIYPASFIVTTGILMFLTKLGARRQMKYAFETPAMLKNVNRLAGTEMKKIEHPDTLNYVLGRVAPAELPKLSRRMVRRLIRMKCLKRFRLFGYLLTAADGTGHLTFTKRHCETCLTQKHGDTIVYYHTLLEAKIVTEDGMAISIATEFIENADPEATKQDCERKAFYRLAAELKHTFPQTQLCLLLDALYLCEPVVRICRENHWAWIITFKEGSLPERFREYNALLSLSPENHLQTVLPGGTFQEFRWIEGLPVGDEKINVLECVETSPSGEITRYVWGTSFPLNAHTVCPVANRGGRLRWKIENEGFNEQKNGGYELEHAYSKNYKKAKEYYVLLQMAQTVELLMRFGSLIRRAIGGSVRKVIGGVRKLAEYLKESLRVWVIPEEAFDVKTARSIQIRLDTS